MKKIILLMACCLIFGSTSYAGGGIYRDSDTGDLHGEVEVWGNVEFITEELLDEEHEFVYFKILGQNDDNLPYILDELIAEDNAHVKYDGENYKIKIGCHDQTNHAVGTPFYTINEREYWELITSENIPSYLTLNFDELADLGGACITLMEDVTVTTVRDESDPSGEYEVYGYYTEEEQELYDSLYDIGYIIMTGYNNAILGAYFEAQIEQGNTVNKMSEDGYYQVGIGCSTGESVGPYWFDIEGEEFEALENSDADNPLTFNFIFGAMPEVDGACISHLTDLEIVGLEQEDSEDNEDEENESTFPDVDSDHPNFNAIEEIYDLEIIDGYPDGTFLPDGEINRAELTKMVVEMNVGEPDINEYSNCFPDVNEEWFAPHVCYAKEHGWIDGYPDGTFKPANTTNRAEAIKIILNSFYDGEDNIPKLTDEEDSNYLHFTDLPYYGPDDEMKPWYYDFATFAIYNELLDLAHISVVQDSDIRYYHFELNMTRKEVAEMIYRLVNP